MFGVSTPTFVTPDTKANAQLQLSSQNAQIFYFPSTFNGRIFSISSCSLCGSKRRAARSRHPYFSRPLSAGGRSGDAVLGLAQIEQADPVPRLPFRPPNDYLRDAMVKALEGGRRVDFRVQLQNGRATYAD